MRFRTCLPVLALLTIAAATHPSSEARADELTTVVEPTSVAAADSTPSERLTMPTQVFFLESTDLVRVSLRRFLFAKDSQCTTSWGCDASNVIADSAPASAWPDSTGDHSDVVAHADARWPSTCETCGAAFPDSAEFQLRRDTLYRGALDGRLYTLRDAPIGAMWDAHWMRHGDSSAYQGPDGLSLVRALTRGEDARWRLDGRRSSVELYDAERRRTSMLGPTR